MISSQNFLTATSPPSSLLNAGFFSTPRLISFAKPTTVELEYVTIHRMFPLTFNVLQELLVLADLNKRLPLRV